MSFLHPHFDPDVFVSYSHGDPRGTGGSMLKDWTQALIRKLEDQILSLNTEFDDMRVWIDAKIDPTATLDEHLRAQVSSSGVLLIVMSDRYLKSSWCRDELEWFHKQIDDRAGEQGRVFVVRAQATRESEWPEFLRGDRGAKAPGFNFIDPENGQPLGWPNLAVTSADFVRELRRLETALTLKLRELKERAEKRAAPPPAPAFAGDKRIYLHAAAAGEAARLEIDSALKAEGIASLTLKITPGPLEEARKQSKMRVAAVKRCAALALVRAGDDDSFVDDLFDIGVDECSDVARQRGAPLPCAVLDKIGGDLPYDVEPLGIARFDLTRPTWRGDFRHWLDAGRPGAGA